MEKLMKRNSLDNHFNLKNYHSKFIKYVEDRKGHDFRYALNSSKIKNLGWKNKCNFEESLTKTLEWYLSNKNFLS